MYTVAFRYAENDVEMSLKIDEFFDNNRKMKSKPCAGIEIALAIVTIAGFTLEFSKFVIDYIVKPIKEKKTDNEKSNDENNLSAARCIVYNGKIITPFLITEKLADKECTPENVLNIICDELQIQLME